MKKHFIRLLILFTVLATTSCIKSQEISELPMEAYLVQDMFGDVISQNTDTKDTAVTLQGMLQDSCLDASFAEAYTKPLLEIVTIVPVFAPLSLNFLKLDKCPTLPGLQRTIPREKIWLLGGHPDKVSPAFNDIWAFDPENIVAPWKLITANAPWAGRKYFGAVSYRDKVWVMGGDTGPYVSAVPTNDVWSFNGTTWTRHADAPWAKRSRFGTVVFQDKIWVLGGNAGLYTNLFFSNDVWSFDGTTWTSHGNAPWVYRKKMGAIVYDNKLWVIAGESAGQALNDFWSFDGTTWVHEINPPIQLTPRSDVGATVFGGKLWLMGGNMVLGNYLNDVMSSAGDYLASASWAPRTEFGVASLGNKIWVMGGAVGGNYNNEVFGSSDGLNWLHFDNVPANVSIDDAPWAKRDGFQLLKVGPCLQDNW